MKSISRNKAGQEGQTKAAETRDTLVVGTIRGPWVGEGKGRMSRGQQGSSEDLKTGAKTSVLFVDVSTGFAKLSQS